MIVRRSFVAGVLIALLVVASSWTHLTSARAKEQTPQPQDATPQTRETHATGHATDNALTQTTPQTPRPAPTPQASPTPPKQSGADNDDEVLSVNTSLVNVLFNAVDRDRRFVTTLKPEDVRVYENDAPQTVSIFQRETELPLSLAILVDVSGSQEHTLPDEQEAARQFVESILRPGKDTAAVISFTGTSTLEQGLTQDRALLQTAIEQLKVVPPASKDEELDYKIGENSDIVPPEVEEYGLPGSTAMWDAVWVTANEIMTQTDASTRRAIILLSDGADYNSRLKKEDAVEAAVKANTVVYSIGIGDEDFNEGNLKKIAERTGGRAFFPQDDTQLRAAFAQIQQELRTQYLIAYTPTDKTRDGSWRRIRIELVNKKLRDDKIKLTYRDGYFAASPQARPPKREHTPQERLKRPPRKYRKP
jgi:Ca-activated chloride channel family protein